MNDFMEGVNEDDYCQKCGELLVFTMKMPDGNVRVVNHEINGEECLVTQEEIFSKGGESNS